VNFLGMPTTADANVPYMVMNEWYAWNHKKNNFKMEVNSDFADDVAKRMKEKGLSKTDPVILTCRSGSRSAKAADLLAGLGYTNVYTIVSGFEGDKVKDGPLKGQRAKNGWKNSDLPWTYKLQMAKMYKVGGE
jgi:rhodanese-related sulfurtransferase